MWSAWVAAALAAGPVDGERLRFVADWMGIEAGTATATTARRGDDWRVDVTSKSAPWLARMYPVDDRLSSLWAPSVGTRRYETIFREGRFQQDQVMEFADTGIIVSRHQRFEEGWRRWQDQYPATPGVEDPVSALWRLRVDGPGNFSVFSGKKVIPVDVVDRGVERLEGQLARRLDVRTGHEGDLRDRMSVWLAEDEARVPLRAVVATRAGPVTVRLVERVVSVE